MKIQNMTWKDKVWVVSLVLAGLFVLGMFSYQAVKDLGSSFTVTNSSNVILTPNEYAQLLK